VTTEFHRALLDAASAPYRSAGRFAWHFSRSKLKRDPVFVGLLERGVIPDAQRLVDLGCGQGLLASWLRSARALHDAGHWRPDWPAPPNVGRIFGIELMPKDVERARVALAGRGDFVLGDLRTADFGRAEVFVILDVLHYIEYHDQLNVLRRVRDALPPGGLFVTRVGNATAGLPFLVSQWVDKTVSFFRGHRIRPTYCRSTADWTAILEQLGFRVDSIPMSRRTPFANVMLIARVDESVCPRAGDRDSVC
jgi:SAM-dependent methyltransferase